MATPLLPGVRKDIAAGLDAAEARWLVDQYYQIQDFRIQAKGQQRAITQNSDAGSAELVEWLGESMQDCEREIHKALDAYSSAHVPGIWAKSIIGIGPVIAAGLLAHIDIKRAPTVGHIWAFAGLDPTKKWLGNAGAAKLLGYVVEDDPSGIWDQVDVGDLSVLSDSEIEALSTLDDGARGQLSRDQLLMVSRLTNRKLGNLLRAGMDEKGRVTRASMLKLLAKRPWNAKLKVLTWKIGDSFVKFQNNPNDVYGKVYVERKGLEVWRNEEGMFADQARDALATRRIQDKELRATYEAGRLPAGRLDLRARRYAVKLFLSHLHHVWFESFFGTPPPRPYILDNPTADPTGAPHSTFIAPPNWPMGGDD